MKKARQQEWPAVILEHICRCLQPKDRKHLSWCNKELKQIACELSPGNLRAVGR